LTDLEKQGQYFGTFHLVKLSKYNCRGYNELAQTRAVLRWYSRIDHIRYRCVRLLN
jgi:hypothetical protein